MEHFPAVLSREESHAVAARIEAHFDQHGFGLWAMEIQNVASLAGFVGLSVPSFEAHFTPCVEIGWRLAAEHWGRGYATEGARAVLTFGFQTLALGEIVSFTVAGNARARQLWSGSGWFTTRPTTSIIQRCPRNTHFDATSCTGLRVRLSQHAFAAGELCQRVLQCDTGAGPTHVRALTHVLADP